MSPFSSLIAVAVFVTPLFSAVAFSAFWTARARRKTRMPIDFKLLRTPGETLRRKMAQMDENLPQNLFGFSVAIVVSSFLGFAVGVSVFPKNSGIALGIAGVCFVIGTALFCRWLAGTIQKRRNLLLGYLGERAVGEQLDALRADGYRVVHDFPAEANSRRFNLDHIVVGRNGLFVIETKTRRKGRARPGYKEHEVFYDGRQLVWPWGEDSHGIDQTAREARWLGDWVKTMTGLSVPVKPILALPGWWVERRAKPPFGILNEKNLVAYIVGSTTTLELSAGEIGLIARQLEARCRDVED